MAAVEVNGLKIEYESLGKPSDPPIVLIMGLGFGWMPAYLVAEELRAGALRELPYVGGSRYRFTPQLAVIARIENALDEDYEDVYGFNTPGAGAYLGVRLGM